MQLPNRLLSPLTGHIPIINISMGISFMYLNDADRSGRVELNNHTRDGDQHVILAAPLVTVSLKLPPPRYRLAVHLTASSTSPIMVANKKPSTAALGAGSRTNSTQGQAGKPKSPSTQAAGSSSPINGALSPNVPAKSTSWFSSSGAKSKKAKKQKSQKPKSRSFVDKAVLFLLSVFVIYTVYTCPFDKTLEDPVCSSLASYRAHIIEPYLLPPVYQAFQHPSVQPYLEKASEIQQQITPYILTAEELARPYVRYAKVLAWDRALVPAYNDYIVPQFHEHIVPQIRAHVSPQLQQLLSQVHPHLSPAYDAAVKAHSLANTAYETTYPHLYQAYSIAKPHALDAYVQVKPYALQGYEIARVKSIEGYELAKPHAIVAYGKALEYLKLALAELVQLRRKYVDKHVGDIWDKVVELSGSKGDGSATASAASLASVVSSTVAETIVSATETVASILSTVVELTPTSSFVEEVEATPSPVEAEEPIVPTPSASSTPVVEVADPTPAAEEIASDSVIDIDLEAFLANLGIADLTEDESTTAAASPSAISVEEDASVQEEPTTAEKRVKIKARYDQWMQQLNELFDVEAINVRTMLNGIRASGAKAVVHQGPEASIIDPELELSEEDKKTILHADGVRVSRVLDILSAEGNVLLNGLDAVLKKEEAERSLESTAEELHKKETKWMDVLQKVENKFYGSVTGIQDKIHAWFTAVRDIEIRKVSSSFSENCNTSLTYIPLVSRILKPGQGTR